MYVVKSDGSDLRKLWREYEVVHFVLSPSGRWALLWILDGGHKGDHPEPNRMAAVNVATGDTKLFEQGVVALEPNSVSNGFEKCPK